MDQGLQRAPTDSVAMRTAKQKARAALRRVYQRQLRENPTRAELFLWEVLRDKQLGEKFTEQAIVSGFIPDFWCGRLRLAIEVDGSVHDTAERREYDQWRDEILARNRVMVLRFTNEQVFENRPYCVEAIKNAIKERSNRPSVRRRETIDRKRGLPQKSEKVKCSCGTKALLFDGKIGPHLMSGKGERCPKGLE